MPELSLPPRPHRLAVPATDGLKTLGPVLLRRAELTPDRPGSAEKIDGRWRSSTWSELADASLRVASGLVAAGLEVGDRLAVLGPTSLRWGVWDFAGQFAGLVTVGVYPKQSAEQLRYLFEHSGTRALAVLDPAELPTVLEATRGLDTLEHIWVFDAAVLKRFGPDDARLSLADESATPLDRSTLEARQQAIDPDTAAILVYTSGTTGPPKAAMISHRNILTLLAHSGDVFPYYEDDLLLSFLPMAHVTERVMAFYIRVASGVAAAYASHIGAVIEELPEVRPTVFGSVPRIFEKVYDRVQTQVAQGSAVKQAIFRWADRIARQRLEKRLAGEPVGPWLEARYGLAQKLVFGKIHAAFGGRVRAGITGAAPVSVEILEFLWAIGLPLIEAYGMTEATVVTHINRLDRPRLGTVGQPVPTIEQRIADDGEILLRGPLVFQGYFRNPEATTEALRDGWLHTGDIGEIDDDGYLRLTDRKKHLIITAGGKNVAPANIEKAIKNQSPLISQVHAHGDRRPYICAMIAPSPIETLQWGARNGVLDPAEARALEREVLADPSARSAALGDAMARVVATPAFRELFVEPVKVGNRDLARVERVRRFFLLDRDLSQEAGEMTPTMKMKRKAIEQIHAASFDRVYSESDFAIEAEEAGG